MEKKIAIAIIVSAIVAILLGDVWLFRDYILPHSGKPVQKSAEPTKPDGSKKSVSPDIRDGAKSDPQKGDGGDIAL